MITGAAAIAVALLTACGKGDETEPAAPSALMAAGIELQVTAVPRPSYLDAAGVVSPIAEATLSTRLMGAVTAVLVREGDVVRAGQPLLRIDSRDLDAQHSRVEAAQAEAAAVLAEAELHVQRMRALHAEEAAPRAQLDAAETGYARARASVAASQAAAAEVAAVSSYAVLRAPFAGTVTSRVVDPGSFAAPGSPLLVVQDTRRLRVSVTAAPNAVRTLRRGTTVTATIEGQAVTAVIEGVVPGAAGLFTVNAIVDNAALQLPATGTATLALPQGTRSGIVVPLVAVLRQGELTGVQLRRDSSVITRWVRLGAVRGDSVEVVSGLQGGDRITVPAAVAGR